ncbi:hypothetical protein [Nocardia brasiliensis]|uniref:Gp37-like protein n=1 Tax=Nocardia brasiliensis TaxID=37326 RepID=UPI0024588F62|nr:hypothetical protein [Nocardia brasiliensis]
MNSSIWTLPDNPLDLSKWFNFDMSTWAQVVKPDLTPDNSVNAIVYGRFKYFHDVSKKVVADAQLSWECRRYLKDEDEPPWPGANLKNGCLVWDLIDSSAFNTGTSFGGDMFGGLVQAVTDFFVSDSDKTMSDTRRTLPDPNFPPEYSTPGYKGTLPACPGVIFYETENGGVSSSEFSWKPATDVGVVGGGKSMPGVNELLSVAVQAVGDLAAAIPGVPPLGGIADTILRPIYSNVFMAFGKWRDPIRATRLSRQGFYYHERWADGADTGYTIAWLLAMRTGWWQSREVTRHKLTVQDGASGWIVGQRGHGHFFLGDRIGSTILGMPPGKIFVDRVSELTLSWSRTEAPSWEITIGQKEPDDPVIKAWEQFQEILSILHDLGVM